MGFDFFDFFDWLKIACLLWKNFNKSWKNRQKRLALHARVRIFVQNSEGDRARPEKRAKVQRGLKSQKSQNQKSQKEYGAREEESTKKRAGAD